jgi:hypothetical protein
MTERKAHGIAERRRSGDEQRDQRERDLAG